MLKVRAGARFPSHSRCHSHSIKSRASLKHNSCSHRLYCSNIHAVLKLTSTHFPVSVTWSHSSCSMVAETCYYQASLVFSEPAQLSFSSPHFWWCKSRCMVLDSVIRGIIRGEWRHFRVPEPSHLISRSNVLLVNHIQETFQGLCM